MRMKNLSYVQHRGMTLIELIIVIAFVGILMAVGLPSMRGFIQAGRITTVTNELVGALLVARSEAIRQNAPACVCPAEDTNNDGVFDACAGGGNWEGGWMSFSDANGDCVLDAGEVLLKVWDGSDYSDQITVRTDSATINAVNSVRFNSRGEPFVNGASQQGIFSICDERAIGVADADGNVSEAAAVVLNASGRARASRNAALITYTAPSP